MDRLRVLVHSKYQSSVEDGSQELGRQSFHAASSSAAMAVPSASFDFLNKKNHYGGITIRTRHTRTTVSAMRSFFVWNKRIVVTSIIVGNCYSTHRFRFYLF